jgi:uncharacterized integral membrane protein
MVVLGFIVLALAVASVGILIGANTAKVDVSALGGTWTVERYWLVITGVVLTAAAILGILLVVLGGARARRLRRRRRDLERENRRLASQVGTAPMASGAGPGRPVDGDTRHVQPAPAPAEAFPAPIGDPPPPGDYRTGPDAGFAPAGTPDPPR